MYLNFNFYFFNFYFYCIIPHHATESDSWVTLDDVGLVAYGAHCARSQFLTKPTISPHCGIFFFCVFWTTASPRKSRPAFRPRRHPGRKNPRPGRDHRGFFRFFVRGPQYPVAHVRFFQIQIRQVFKILQH